MTIANRETAPTAAVNDELPTTYRAAEIEAALYARWQAAGTDVARVERVDRAGGDRQPYTIVMPPPNVTAILHVGHGLNNAVQDVLIRWRRMAGDEALWVPGTDHAGIATQNVVEKQLAAEGSSKAAVGRDAFVARTTQFVETTGGQILDQLKAIGASADWSRTAYTLSPPLSTAVTEAFVRLFDEGLVYRGHRVIHWCPRCLTSLSDEEAEFNETQGALYHIRYLLADDPSQSIVVATTRPETLLGDVAVAVNPTDERYAHLVGKLLVLPINGVRIPVIADDYTDAAFGSGAVKITPAHDPNDFEVGMRHALDAPIIMDADARMHGAGDAIDRVPPLLRGVDRFEARERIVNMLRDDGALVKVEAHQHSVRHCYRCDTVVEPRLSDQWFVKMAPLAKPALEAVRTGRIRIMPERWEAVYINWLDGIRDWNISRQLWWGHRVPVYYCDRCNTVPKASRTPVTTCAECGSDRVRQDEDVLDTWFSSWLWPISTLGWPNEHAADLKAFYPGDVLVTAPEILFFWVSRMIMSGLHFMGDAPYHTVYLHGTVRDMQHRKMSKSLGNGIDPMDVVRLYGADALRWTMIAGMGMGVDVLLDPTDLEKSFAPGRNFLTKLWNIGRFLLTKVGTEPVQPLHAIAPESLTIADRWILDRLDVAIAESNAALGPVRPGASGRWTDAERTAGMRLDAYADTARRFVWNELADWYLETVKPRLAAGGSDADVARAVLVHCFDNSLRLLQPIIPFITETLWAKLPGLRDGSPRGAEFLCTSAWPVSSAFTGKNEITETRFDLVINATISIRVLRNEYKVKPGRILAVTLHAAENDRSVAPDLIETIGALTRTTVSLAHSVSSETSASSGSAAHAVLPGGSELSIEMVELMGEESVEDTARECARLKSELENTVTILAGVQSKLGNESFTSRAKPDVVEGARAQERDLSQKVDALRRKVEALCGTR
ncbi:MAG: valine--tRNA ligase [Gemmatimonadaceae bacterium]|nr:valine--tRNA ligase [Gemmatimonadaceae bacterium]